MDIKFCDFLSNDTFLKILWPVVWYGYSWKKKKKKKSQRRRISVFHEKKETYLLFKTYFSYKELTAMMIPVEDFQFWSHAIFEGSLVLF